MAAMACSGLAASALLLTVASFAEALPSGVASAASTAEGKPSCRLVLYQYEICPWCCKVKAYLDYHKIAYKVVDVNPLTKKELKWSEYKKVPVLLLDGEVVTESSAIIDRLHAERQGKGEKPAASGWWLWRTSGAAGADGGKAGEAEKLWRAWVDERLVRVLTANIYRTWGESWQTFQYISQVGNLKEWERLPVQVCGAVLMYVVGMRLPKKYSIEGDLRENLYSDIDNWVDALEGRPFLGGNVPNLADLAVFGVIRAVENTDTFYALLENTKVLPWWQRMVDAVGDSSRVNCKPKAIGKQL